MSKFDFTKTISIVQDSYKKDQRRAQQFGLGNSLEKLSDNEEDFVVMPDFLEFKKYFGIMGIPFGKFIQWSGKPDAGKTTFAMVAIKAAQEQGYGVIYVETEGKTGPERLMNSGIDPNGVITISSSVTEEIFEGVNKTLDAFFDQYPEDKILLVFDSYGNTTSMRDKDLDLTQKVGMVGGAAKTNRIGLSAIKARQLENDIAVLVINYSYANLGSVGETNAGGRALEFLCSLVVNCSRTGWYEKQVKGEKVRAGAHVKWRTVKNHLSLGLQNEDGETIMLPKELNLTISGEGVKVRK